MTGRTTTILGLILLTGCYTGTNEFDQVPFGADGPGASGAEEGGGEGGGDGDPDASCLEPDAGFSALRRLTRHEYENTVTDLLGVSAGIDQLPMDARDGLFQANTTYIDQVMLSGYESAAGDVASAAVPVLDQAYACDEDLSDHACAEQLVDTLGRRLHRRTLEPEDRADYLALYERGGSHAEGLELMLGAMLQSPYFLYRIETTVGDEEVGLVDDWALASRLSYFLWRSAPDDALLDAAEAGTLHEPEELEAQARRLLEDPRHWRGVVDFHRQWLGLDHLDDAYKAPGIEFDADLRDAMIRETNAFIERVSTSGDSWLPTLLTSNVAHIDDPALAEIYGLDPESMEWGEDVTLPPERSGILSRAGFVVAHSHPDQVSPVLMGHFIRTRMLCQSVPAAAADIDTTLPDHDPDLSMRERYSKHVEEPKCAGCHVLMDGIGFSYEGYDPVGHFEGERDGEPVDASGMLVGTDVTEPEFEGPVGLAEKLAGSETMKECATSAWLAFGLHRQGNAHDACAYEELLEVANSEHDSVESLVMTIVTSKAFRLRRSTPDM